MKKRLETYNTTMHRMGLFLKVVAVLYIVFTPAILWGSEKQLLLVYGDERIADFSISYFEKKKLLTGYRVHKIFHEDFSPSLYRIEQGAIVITLGTAPAVTVAKSGLKLPAYALFITRTAYRFIRKEFGDNTIIMPFYLDQPFERQATFVKTLFPENKKIAVLYGPASSTLKPHLEESFAQKAISIEYEIVDANDNVAKALERLLAHRHPVLSIADSIAVSPNNSKWLLYMAYQRNIPVIGFSSSFTRAGALASIYSSPEQVLRYFAEVFPLDSRKPSMEYYPKYYSIDINDSVARSLKLNLPTKRAIVSAIDGDD